jgi:Glycosyltransferase
LHHPKREFKEEEKPEKKDPNARPKLLFVSSIPFNVLSGYVTQMMYQLGAMAKHYDVTYATPRRPDATKYWRETEHVTIEEIDLPPAPFWTQGDAGKNWLGQFDLIVFRNQNYHDLFKQYINQERVAYYVSGSGIKDLVESKVDACHAVVMQGSAVNYHYKDRGLSISKAFPIPCTVPANKFEWRSSKPVFMVISSLTKDKGVENIIDALEPIKHKLRLIVIGDFLVNHVKLDPEYYDFLEKKINNGWVEWLGAMTPQAIPFAIRPATAIIHYNRMKGRFDETLQSTKILEAMAAGKPVIAFDSFGTQSLVGEGYPFLVHEDADIPVAVEKILADLKGARNWGYKLHARIKKYFDIDPVGDRWGELLHKQKHVIWYTSCLFQQVKGDAAQTIYNLKALSNKGFHVDVVFPDGKPNKRLLPDIANCVYYPSADPSQKAVELWNSDPRACVVSRGVKLTSQLIGKIPKDNLYPYLYGGHWETPTETLNEIQAASHEIITQNIDFWQPQ